jgi:hypothetical protein
MWKHSLSSDYFVSFFYHGQFDYPFKKEHPHCHHMCTSYGKFWQLHHFLVNPAMPALIPADLSDEQ